MNAQKKTGKNIPYPVYTDFAATKDSIMVFLAVRCKRNLFDDDEIERDSMKKTL